MGRWAVDIQFNDALVRSSEHYFSPERDSCTERKRSASPLAILLDGKVLSSPVSQAVISDGKPQITGVTSPSRRQGSRRSAPRCSADCFTIQSGSRFLRPWVPEQLRIGSADRSDWSAAGVS